MTFKLQEALTVKLEKDKNKDKTRNLINKNAVRSLMIRNMKSKLPFICLIYAYPAWLWSSSVSVTLVL